MDKAFLSEDLVSRLRQMASRGTTIRKMVEKIRHHVNTDDGLVFVVTRYLREAFFLTVGDAWDIGACTCLGGKTYDDQQIDDLLLPLIESKRQRWESELKKEKAEGE